MLEITNLAKPRKSEDGVLYKTARLVINIVTNVLMCLTVFVCVLYACSTKKLTLFHWHIILCVLGYQFFMNQGTLVISRFNSWSIYLSRKHKKLLHITFQIAGLSLILVGSSVIFCEMDRHFNTAHGTLGISAVITSFISLLNGVAANYAYELSSSYVLCIKYIHCFSGILTLFLSAGSLSAALEGRSFRIWLSNDDAVTVLVLITWIFTMFVAFDFWLLTGNRLRGML